MNNTTKLIVGIGATLGVAVASAYAHPGQMGGGMQGGMHGMHGMHGGMGQQGAGQQLMTPEERSARQEKMRAATPEERQKLAAEHRAEMEKRAKERGVTLNEHRGPRGPRTQEHKH